jgi:hypothetical protein
VSAQDPVLADVALPLLQDRPSVALTAYEPVGTIVAEREEFRGPDSTEPGTRLERPIISHRRSMYEPAAMREAAFGYHSIGRRAV